MTTYIQDKNGKTIDSSIAKTPQFRHFRNAWVINGDVISEDLATAKTLFKDKIREVRKPLLELEDVNYMRALEDGNTAKAKEIADKKKVLRDLPADTKIDSAKDIDELKKTWNENMLGTSPYK
tara:strand:+ start:1377 stop:1745 length:369 start_codon:yes stop_codon:yes gene_type:complete